MTWLLDDDQDVLATDVEREAGLQQLGDGLARGQLTTDEYNDRVSRVLQARTCGDIAAQTKDIGPADAAPTPSRRRGRLIGGVVVVAFVAVGAATAAILHHQACVTPNAPGATCVAPPPADATLTGKSIRFGVDPPPHYLGDKRILTAQGSDSQTSPTFRLDGGVLTVVASQANGSAYFYLVPAGQPLDVTEHPFWQLPAAAGMSNVVSTVPDPGRYRLYALSAGGTSWRISLNEFWPTPPGVTAAPTSTVPDAGRTLVAVRGIRELHLAELPPAAG